MLGFVLVGIALAAGFKWTFSDSLYFDRGSLKYWVLVPKAIREAPVFGDAPGYHYSAGDGSWVGGTSVFFTTGEGRDALVARYRKYYAARGGRLVAEGDDWRIELPDGHWLRLRIGDEDGRRRVEIMRFRS